jgi:hypothetical protein
LGIEKLTIKESFESRPPLLIEPLFPLSLLKSRFPASQNSPLGKVRMSIIGDNSVTFKPP